MTYSTFIYPKVLLVVGEFKCLLVLKHKLTTYQRAFTGIEIYDQDGGRHLVWVGSMEPTRTARIFTLDIDADFPSDRIRIILDTRRVSGWNKIDAVVLVGTRYRLQSDIWSYREVLIDAPPSGWVGVISGEAI